jgi:hypothetical protein
MSMQAQARKFEIARTMFLNTADENYIGARSAFFEQRNLDFWWGVLHSTEKYLKATLLLNGRSARIRGHSISDLVDAVRKIDPRLTPPTFERPSKKADWRDFAVRDFFVRLDTYGSASGRYATYSYTVFQSDLYCADQLVYWARRHAQPLRTVHGTTKIDWIKELADNRRLWRQMTGAPLERIADLPSHVPERRALVRLNRPFFPNTRHRFGWYRSFASNGPIYRALRGLERSAPGSVERREARGVIEWVLANVYLIPNDTDDLRLALRANP